MISYSVGLSHCSFLMSVAIAEALERGTGGEIGSALFFVFDKKQFLLIAILKEPGKK